MVTFPSLSKFFGNAASTAAGVAAGGATIATLEPVLQSVTNEAWQANPTKPPDVISLALGVAQGKIDASDAASWAKDSGFGSKQLDALIAAASRGPELGEAMELYRRGVFDELQFQTALNRLGIDQSWWTNIQTLKDDRLTPEIIARSIHRGIMRDPGFLPVGPPTEVGKVAAFPVSPLDPLAEAAASGINSQRLFVETGIVGLPASPDEAARATFRGIIDRVDFDRAISEGNTRNEWGETIFEAARQIPTSHEFVEDTLRGWSDQAAMYAGAAQHGMSEGDVDLLFRISGRPLSWHQVWIGLARGGIYDGPTDAIDPAFLKALQESNIRPEWYNLAWAQRYSYPAAFVLKNLVSSGDITQADAEQVLLFEGWEPTFAAKAAAAWAGGATSSSSTPTKTYTTSAVRAISKNYIDSQISEDEAASDLTALGVTAAEQSNLFEIWDVTRKAAVKHLTAPQVKAAYRTGVLDEPTALARLEQLDYSAADATTYLAT